MVMRRLSALAAIATLAVALLWLGPTEHAAAAKATTTTTTTTTTSTTTPAGSTPADTWVLNAPAAEQHVGSVQVAGK